MTATTKCCATGLVVTVDEVRGIFDWRFSIGDWRTRQKVEPIGMWQVAPHTRYHWGCLLPSQRSSMGSRLESCHSSGSPVSRMAFCCRAVSTANASA